MGHLPHLSSHEYQDESEAKTCNAHTNHAEEIRCHFAVIATIANRAMVCVVDISADAVADVAEFSLD